MNVTPRNGKEPGIEGRAGSAEVESGAVLSKLCQCVQTGEASRGVFQVQGGSQVNRGEVALGLWGLGAMPLPPTSPGT